MPTKILNIIYDTNYTGIIANGGFVNHKFSIEEKKSNTGFFDLLFGNSSKEEKKINEKTQENSQTSLNSQNNQQPQQTQNNQEKPPSFWELLFGPLGGKKEGNKMNENINQKSLQISDQTSNQVNQQATSNIPNSAENNKNEVQVQTNISVEKTTENNIQNTEDQTIQSQNDIISNNSEIQNSIQNQENSQNNNAQNNQNGNGSNKNRLDSFLDKIFGPEEPKKQDNKNTKDSNGNNKSNDKKTTKITPQDELRDEIKKILEISDEEYKDSMLTSDMRKFIKQVDEEYSANISDYKSHIAPSYWEYTSNSINISGILGKTYYTQRYPTYIDALWTRDLMGMHAKWDLSFFIYPEDDGAMQAMLKRKSTQIKAELNESISKGVTTDKELEQQYNDVEMIREKLSTREERYFEVSNYFTIYNTDENNLREDGKKFEQKISGYGIAVKTANHRMDEGMSSTLPLCMDDLGISRSAVTSSLAGSFPFISNDLVQNSGIFYGLNLHTGGLVILDRFSSKLPNMNSVILATSGAGKSFTVKLEILRYLLNGVDIIVIDPENEYKDLCEAVGGTYVNIATNSQQYINPFDIPPRIEDVEYGKGDLLRSQIMTLIGLIQILIGKMSAEEEAILDKALQNTYSLHGFSFEENDYEGKQSPLMEDLMNILNGMEGGEQLGLRISKYVSGTFGKLFNNETNVDINNRITVFSIRDLEDALKTPAMYNVLNFIWTKVRSTKRQRLLICDEAWIMLQNDVSANFLFSMAKRARKYGLGITTISQDIEDFVRSQYGKPIVSNSALQILLKQSTTSIKSLNQLLGLSEAEQQKLISCGVGEGLIFAGNQHIAIKMMASPTEKSLITTDVKKNSA